MVFRKELASAVGLGQETVQASAVGSERLSVYQTGIQWAEL